MGISCCDTDNCTAPLPQWPAASSQANGLLCPSCRSQTQQFCNQKTNIQCTGSEQTCLMETTMVSVSSSSAMGCATPTLCDVGSYFYSYTVRMDLLCFSAPNSSATGTLCVMCSAQGFRTCNGSLSVIPANSRCATTYQIQTSGEWK